MIAAEIGSQLGHTALFSSGQVKGFQKILIILEYKKNSYL
jgi:hypothetical protein